MKSHIFPGLFLSWYMEVGILENYGGTPLPLLEGGSDGFRCLHFFFVHKLMQCLQPVEVPVGIDKAAYDVLDPCKPGLNLKGRV